jgi:glycosyltransferase involved in cell wall biosynthesis
VIVVQTEDQLRRGRSRVTRPLRVIRSFAEDAGDTGEARTAFLWIGRIVDYKDPLAYVELARQLPQADFLMVADASGNEDPPLFRELQVRADSLPNLRLLEPLPRDQLLEFYRRAVAVVNTSHVEGFPNTFMEGWARGAPALSLRLDPDRIIQRYGLGSFAAGSPERLAEAARDLWALRTDRAMSDRTRRYIRAEHSPEVIGGRWIRLLNELEGDIAAT